MPIASDQVVRPKEEEAVSVRIEPAQALFADFFLLEKVEGFSGIDPWVERTVQALSPARRRKNHQVLTGLYFALMPRKSYPDFPSYLADLANQDPAEWIDNLFDTYDRLAPDKPNLDRAERAELLKDFDQYLAYLQERFDEEHIDEAVERKAHELLNDPTRMQAEALEHLTYMWEEHLQFAWEQALPLLEDSVRAFQEIEWPQGTHLEIAEWVTGHDMTEYYHKSFPPDLKRMIFVPSTHVGPYVITYSAGGTIWLVFGARVPEGASLHSPALSRSQLLVRLNALADENRLHILDLLRDSDELCAQEIIEEINLSQSSASRHLRQLSATGYILERRRESAKCYRLNPEQSKETVAALADFLDVSC